MDIKRIEGMKSKLIKAGSPNSTIRSEEWRNHYSSDVAYLIQELENIQSKEDTKRKRKIDA